MTDLANKRDTELFIRDSEWTRWGDTHGVPVPHATWNASWAVGRSISDALEIIIELKLRTIKTGYVIGLMMDKNKATGTEEWCVVLQPQSTERQPTVIPPFRSYILMEALQNMRKYLDENPQPAAIYECSRT